MCNMPRQSGTYFDDFELRTEFHPMKNGYNTMNETNLKWIFNGTKHINKQNLVMYKTKDPPPGIQHQPCPLPP